MSKYIVIKLCFVHTYWQVFWLKNEKKHSSSVAISDLQKGLDKWNQKLQKWADEARSKQCRTAWRQSDECDHEWVYASAILDSTVTLGTVTSMYPVLSAKKLEPKPVSFCDNRGPLNVRAVKNAHQLTRLYFYYAV